MTVIILSLLPHKPRSGIENGQLEHLLAYMGTAVMLGLAYRSRVAVVLALALVAVVLEAAQLWLPGRHAQLIDIGAGVLGACLGTCLLAVADRVRRLRDPSRQEDVAARDGS